MNIDWQTFLSSQGAQIQDGVVQNFGDALAERFATSEGTVLCDLSQFGLIKVSGEGASNFLHNLLSTDINALTPRYAIPSSFNTAKGRTLTTMLVWCNGTDYFLNLPKLLLEMIQKKLTMYVLRAKVKIENVSDSMVCLGISGSNAVNILKHHFPELPPEELNVVHRDDICLIRLNTDRFQITCPTQLAPSIWLKLKTETSLVGSPCWDWLNIIAGIPIILPQTQEEFVPQMVNLDLIGAVNFKKGCYPGQEIVARMQYLGKLKRRMYLAHVENSVLPQAGSNLFCADLEGQACGMVVNAQASPGDGYDLLAVVQIASHDSSSVHIGGLNRNTLQFRPLPYPIP